MKIEISYDYRDIKKAGNKLIVIYNPIGEWNGYWYDQYPKEIIFPKTKIHTYLRKKTEIKKEIIKKVITEEMKRIKWSKRLSKLALISLEEAEDIAQDKLDYKEEKIIEIEKRWYSQKREILLNKMKRANPLRRIEDVEHAQAILSASHRHNNTNYDELLDEWRFQANIWNIQKDEVRDFARYNFIY